MKPEIKKRWVAALRSGNYKQGKGYLRYIPQDLEPRYCCLGVLCDLVKDELDIKWEHNMIQYKGASLPCIIRHYTGLDEWGVFARTDDQYVERDNREFSNLAQLNDYGFSFEEIAQVIEEKF